jgi:hypothetical protein
VVLEGQYRWQSSRRRGGCEHTRRKYRRKRTDIGFGRIYTNPSRRQAEDKYWVIRIKGHQYNSKLLAYLYPNGEWTYSLENLKAIATGAKRDKKVYWDLDRYCWMFDKQEFKTEAEAIAARHATMTEEEIRSEAERKEMFRQMLMRE